MYSGVYNIQFVLCYSSAIVFKAVRFLNLNRFESKEKLLLIMKHSIRIRKLLQFSVHLFSVDNICNDLCIIDKHLIQILL